MEPETFMGQETVQGQVATCGLPGLAALPPLVCEGMHASGMAALSLNAMPDGLPTSAGQG